jgi:hypothetical protein
MNLQIQFDRNLIGPSSVKKEEYAYVKYLKKQIKIIPFVINVCILDYTSVCFK